MLGICSFNPTTSEYANLQNATSTSYKLGNLNLPNTSLCHEDKNQKQRNHFRGTHAHKSDSLNYIITCHNKMHTTYTAMINTLHLKCDFQGLVSSHSVGPVKSPFADCVFASYSYHMDMCGKAGKCVAKLANVHIYAQTKYIMYPNIRSLNQLGQTTSTIGCTFGQCLCSTLQGFFKQNSILCVSTLFSVLRPTMTGIDFACLKSTDSGLVRK